MYNYPEVFSKLTYEVATLVFLKKDGTVRVMLGTRNIRTAEIDYGFLGGKLGSRDSNCNIKTGNIAVIDMAIGDIRAFSVDRLVSIEYHGIVETAEQLEEITGKFLEFKRNYEEHIPKSLTMDMLD